MGRPVPPQVNLSYFGAVLLHLTVCCVYGLILALLVTTFRPALALLAGAVSGLGLYVLNYAVFRFLMPAMTGLEWPVALAHIFFGLVATALYRGMAKRRAPDAPPESDA